MSSLLNFAERNARRHGDEDDGDITDSPSPRAARRQGADANTGEDEELQLAQEAVGASWKGAGIPLITEWGKLSKIAAPASLDEAQLFNRGALTRMREDEVESLAASVSAATRKFLQHLHPDVAFVRAACGADTLSGLAVVGEESEGRVLTPEEAAASACSPWLRPSMALLCSVQHRSSPVAAACINLLREQGIDPGSIEVLVKQAAAALSVAESQLDEAASFLLAIVAAIRFNTLVRFLKVLASSGGRWEGEALSLLSNPIVAGWCALSTDTRGEEAGGPRVLTSWEQLRLDAGAQRQEAFLLSSQFSLDDVPFEEPIGGTDKRGKSSFGAGSGRSRSRSRERQRGRSGRRSRSRSRGRSRPRVGVRSRWNRDSRSSSRSRSRGRDRSSRYPARSPDRRASRPSPRSSTSPPADTPPPPDKEQGDNDEQEGDIELLLNTPDEVRERREKLKTQIHSIPLLYQDRIPADRLAKGQKLYKDGRLSQSLHVLVRVGFWKPYLDEAKTKLLAPFDLSQAMALVTGAKKIILHSHWKELPEKHQSKYVPLPPWADSMDKLSSYLRSVRAALEAAQERQILKTVDEHRECLEGQQGLSALEAVLEEEFGDDKVQIKGQAYGASVVSCVCASGLIGFMHVLQEDLLKKVKAQVPFHCLEPGCLGVEDRHSDKCRFSDKNRKKQQPTDKPPTAPMGGHQGRQHVQQQPRSQSQRYSGGASRPQPDYASQARASSSERDHRKASAGSTSGGDDKKQLERKAAGGGKDGKGSQSG
jgi:hypothetical protein